MHCHLRCPGGFVTHKKRATVLHLAGQGCSGAQLAELGCFPTQVSLKGGVTGVVYLVFSLLSVELSESVGV